MLYGNKQTLEIEANKHSNELFVFTLAATAKLENEKNSLESSLIEDAIIDEDELDSFPSTFYALTLHMDTVLKVLLNLSK